MRESVSRNPKSFRNGDEISCSLPSSLVGVLPLAATTVGFYKPRKGLRKGFQKGVCLRVEDLNLLGYVLQQLHKLTMKEILSNFHTT